MCVGEWKERTEELKSFKSGEWRRYLIFRYVINLGPVIKLTLFLSEEVSLLLCIEENMKSECQYYNVNLKLHWNGQITKQNSVSEDQIRGKINIILHREPLILFTWREFYILGVEEEQDNHRTNHPMQDSERKEKEIFCSCSMCILLSCVPCILVAGIDYVERSPVVEVHQKNI